MTASKRQLGLGIPMATVNASRVGTGVFTSTGYPVHDLRDPTTNLIAWLIDGTVALRNPAC